MSSAVKRCWSGCVSGAGTDVEGMCDDADGAGSERAENEGVERADAGEAGDEVEVKVERKAVKSAFEWIVTGTSSRMLDGTSLFSIKLWTRVEHQLDLLE